MTEADLPRELPLREQDADLDVAALDALRAKIGKHVDDTQGAWARQPLVQRGWPLVVAIGASAAWAVLILLNGTGGLAVAAALAAAAATAAFVAAARAPAHPASSEKLARFALAGGCVALAAEVFLSMMSPPVEGGSDVACARAIVMGALLPSASMALYARQALAPLRMFHVVALAGAAFLASASAVWIECPGTMAQHVLVAHTMVPLLVAAFVVAALRPLLRGRPVPA